MQDFPLITPHRNALLFLCAANSARSQMAEGFARFIGPAEIQYYSAGIRPGAVHPLTLKVMKEVGIDISQQMSKGVNTIPLSHVATCIAICDPMEIPTLPEGIRVVNWEIDDPVTMVASDEDILYEFRRVRDEIRANVSSLF